MSMPEGMSPPDGMSMPEGMTPPDGFPSGGRFPGQSSGDSQQGGFNPGSFPGQSSDDSQQSGFNPGSFPSQSSDDSQQGSFNPGSFPGFSGGDSEQSSSSDSGSASSGESKKTGGPGFGMGMGSDDVKLKYIDDDPDSYSNIFDNAKTEVSKADKKRLIESLEKLNSYTDLEDVVDTDEVLRYFVVHNFVCNGDSYTGMMIHNYYLHESDGKLSMIPWDYNLAFGTFQGGDASGTVNTSIDSPISMGNVDDRPMLGWIFSDESYTEEYHKLFPEFIDKWFTDGELEKLISDTADMIRPYVEKDPTKFCTAEDFEKGVSAMAQFVSLRGEAVSRQLSGDDTAVETGSLNLSDMGSMGGGMGKTPGGFSGGFDITSMIKLMDKDGREVALSEVIEDTSSIKSITLSDGTEIDVLSADMRELMKTDFSQAVSVTDKQGNVTDLSAYTISVSKPSGMNGRGSGSRNSGETTGQNQNADSAEEQGSFPDMPGNKPGEQSAEETESSESRQVPSSGGSVTPPDGFPGSSNSGNSQAKFWILGGISALVLALGIIIALKKKY
ncbi:MAG: CotH kinase family protein [Clostridia bacterium]|nr:CotH kinase family protein [Clostridia bacterium]